MVADNGQNAETPPESARPYAALAKDLGRVRADLDRVAAQEEHTPAGRALRVLSDLADVAVHVLHDPGSDQAREHVAGAVHANPALAVAIGALFADPADQQPDTDVTADEAADDADLTGADEFDAAPDTKSFPVVPLAAVNPEPVDSVAYVTDAELEDLPEVIDQRAPDTAETPIQTNFTQAPSADDDRYVEADLSAAETPPNLSWSAPWPDIRSIERRLDPRWLERLDYTPEQRVPASEPSPRINNVVDIRDSADDDGFADLAVEQHQASLDAGFEEDYFSVDVWEGAAAAEQNASVHQLNTTPPVPMAEQDSDAWLEPGTELLTAPAAEISFNQQPLDADEESHDDPDTAKGHDWYVQPASPKKPLSW